MSPEERVIDYLQQHSKGAVSLSMKHASNLVKLVLGVTPIAVLYHFSRLTNSWEMKYSVNTSMLAIQKNRELYPHNEVEHIERNFYRWLCYDENGSMICVIHTIHTNIF